ncbi:MAG: type II toxin-antitoxin system HicB family antitoxin [Gammaproteobacteria bacterium]|nr:type II toxin-antitoxin system HicB family antitoxin [Gammaproteobacteria bacterium]
MSIHDEILAAARRICAARGEWTFAPAEIVAALPHLNARSVRTHITSRCCVNAPANHPHRLPYFFRTARGTYEICPPFRDAPTVDPASGQAASGEHQIEESAADYVTSRPAERTSIHAVVFESERQYVAECLEVGVVTQGRSLDETLANLHEALALYLDGEDMAGLGLSPSPRLVLNFETTALGP